MRARSRSGQMELIRWLHSNVKTNLKGIKDASEVDKIVSVTYNKVISD